MAVAVQSWPSLHDRQGLSWLVSGNETQTRMSQLRAAPESFQPHWTPTASRAQHGVEFFHAEGENRSVSVEGGSIQVEMSIAKRKQLKMSLFSTRTIKHCKKPVYLFSPGWMNEKHSVKIWLTFETGVQAWVFQKVPLGMCRHKHRGSIFDYLVLQQEHLIGRSASWLQCFQLQQLYSDYAFCYFCFSLSF